MKNLNILRYQIIPLLFRFFLEKIVKQKNAYFYSISSFLWDLFVIKNFKSL